MGSLLGTSVPSLAAIVVGVGMIAGGEAFGFVLMLMPFGVGTMAAGAGILMIGLPTTAWLNRKRIESGPAYLWGGAIGGGLATLVVAYFLFDGFWSMAFIAAAFGALTGGTTGYFWWRFARRQLVETASERIEEVFG